MRVAYLDCFSGIAGDMWVAALLDAGLPFEELRETLAGVPVGRVELQVEAVRRSSIHALRFHVHPLDPDPGHRGLGQILEILGRSRLPERVREDAGRVFLRLAEAEARAHGIPIESVHFHEVGAVDCIVDVVAACWGLWRLGIERVLSAPPPTGTGFVRCAHGRMPVPAPGTLGALLGHEIVLGGPPAELTTPTGAALLGALGEVVEGELALKPTAFGHGAGARDLPERPNFLRILLGELVGGPGREEVLELATNLDQVTPELIGHVLDRTLRAGALDAWAGSVLMKKGRPGFVLHALVEPARRAAVEDLWFAETRTLGIRRQRLLRRKLERRSSEVDLSGERVGIKSRRLPDGSWRHHPEFEDVARIAGRSGRPFVDVWEEAAALARAEGTPPAVAEEVGQPASGSAAHSHPHPHHHGLPHDHHHGHPHDHAHHHGPGVHPPH